VRLIDEIREAGLDCTSELVDYHLIYKVEGVNSYLPIYVWFDAERDYAMVNHQTEKYYTVTNLKHLTSKVYERNWLTIDHNIDWWLKLSRTPNEKWIKLFLKYGFVIEKDGKLIPND
jgi:hypothetical protein